MRCSHFRSVPALIGTVAALASDLVTHIAQNPADRKELAIATRRKTVFLSRDAGKNWKQIAQEGEGL